MKTLMLVTVLAFHLSYSYCQNILSLKEGSSPPAGIEEVAWITGHCQEDAMGGITEEIWSPPIGNAMIAVFRIVKDDKVEFYEIETITEENESLVLRLKHFHANLLGWEEKNETVDFPLVKIEEHTAYFDGMTFEKVSDNELNIFVVIGEEDGKKTGNEISI